MDFNKIASIDFSKVFSPLDAPNGRAPSHNSDSLSFGVEIEFAVAVLGSAEQDLHPNDSRPAKGLLAPSTRYFPGFETANQEANQEAVKQSIARKLNTTFKDAILYTKDMGIDVAHQFWAKSSDMSSLPTPARLSLSGKPRLPAGEWIIKDDMSIRAPDIPGAEKYGWIPIEHSSSRLKTNLGTQKTVNFLSKGLELILAASNVEQLCMRLGIYRDRLGFSIENLRDPAGPSTDPLKRTIEIRIHESTMDPQDVENWVRLFVGVIQFADVVSVEKLEEWLREHINDERGDYDAIQLMYAMKLPQQAHFYLNKLLPRYTQASADEVERLLRLADDAVANARVGT
ncbi:hypothetical protein BDZ45DRAFT_803626 [Acephala macrosclerotiorum]|nr:hypothetical protein BDZ45DRAFT_803626 [Acephala macrosclerotiorum]